MYRKIICKKALNRIRSNYLPYKYDLNIYRGCKHNCIYCFAKYSHKYLDSKDFFKDIYFKENIIEVLEKELSSKSWKGEIINIGGVTDTYQELEKDLELMPKVLKLMIKYENPINICTKSDLILKDIDLIKELSNKTLVNIASSITCIDENIIKGLEPNSPSTERRFSMLERIKQETSANTGVLLMPIFPYITDDVENLEGIFKRALDINIDFAYVGILNLKGDTRDRVFEYIDLYYPYLKEKYLKLYKGSFVDKVYKDSFYIKIKNIKKKYLFKDKRIDYNIKKQLSIF